MESPQEVEWIYFCKGLAEWVKEEGGVVGGTCVLTIQNLNVSLCVSDSTEG